MLPEKPRLMIQISFDPIELGEATSEIIMTLMTLRKLEKKHSGDFNVQIFGEIDLDDLSKRVKAATKKEMKKETK